MARKAIRLAEALDHPYSLILACWRLGYLHGVKGELSHAHPPARACARPVPRLERRPLVAALAAFLGSRVRAIGARQLRVSRCWSQP